MFNIFKKIQFDKVFKESENNYHHLRKVIQNFCQNNHNYKPSIKNTITTQKEKQEILFKKIKTLQDQFDNLPKPVTFKQEIAYYNLNANLLSIYLQLSQELYYLNELEKAYKEGYNDAKKEHQCHYL